MITALARSSLPKTRSTRSAAAPATETEPRPMPVVRTISLLTRKDSWKSACKVGPTTSQSTAVE